MKLALVLFILLINPSDATTKIPCSSAAINADDLRLLNSYCSFNSSGCELVESLINGFPSLEVQCICSSSRALPNCQLELPENTSTHTKDPNNETTNTCIIEDLLMIYQWKNDPKYGRYVQ